MFSKCQNDNKKPCYIYRLPGCLRESVHPAEKNEIWLTLRPRDLQDKGVNALLKCRQPSP